MPRRVVLVGDPETGKTSVAVRIGAIAALADGLKVAYVLHGESTGDDEGHWLAEAARLTGGVFERSEDPLELREVLRHTAADLTLIDLTRETSLAAAAWLRLTERVREPIHAVEVVRADLLSSKAGFVSSRLSDATARSLPTRVDMPERSLASGRIVTALDRADRPLDSLTADGPPILLASVGPDLPSDLLRVDSPELARFVRGFSRKEPAISRLTRTDRPEPAGFRREPVMF